ncbi:MAG: hypothetical protein Kow00124_29660 [Anaerolineae bacterium]
MRDPKALIVLGVAIFNITLFGVFLAIRLSLPSDGARLQPGMEVYADAGVIVTPFDGQVRGLEQGDVVVAIEGRSVESWADLLLCWRPFCDAPDRPRWRVGDTVTYTVLRESRPTEVDVTLIRYPLAANLHRDWGAMLYALALLLTGAFVFTRRPDEPATRLLFLAGSAMVGATTWSFGLQALDFVRPLTFWLLWVTTRVIYLLIWSSALHFALIFPNPHRLVRRHGWVIPAIYGLPFVVHAAAVIAAGLTASGPLDWLAGIGLDQNLTVTAYLLFSLLALVTNYYDQPSLVGRQQIRVVVHAVLLITAAAVLLWQLPQIVQGEQWLTPSAMAVVGLLLPLSLLVSILRYRLWDIDVVINRTTVYGLLTVIIAGLYIAVVGVLGALFRQRGNLLFSLIATGLVAVIFQPLREGLQRFVNRLMYGERDDPYQVITRLGRQLQSAAAPEDLLHTITHTVAGALKLPYAGVAILIDGVFVTQTEYGIPPEQPYTVPLVYQRQVVGRLMAAPRSLREPLGPADISLLQSIAQHAGVVVQAVRLNRDLQRSHERLVITREEERRRLRRDLHDGLGPTLASHTLRLDAILDLIDTDPAQARRQVEVLKVQTKEIVADIRRLVYELRPPTLDELGLVEAVRAHLLQSGSGQQGPAIAFEAPPDGLPPLTAAVEVAAYRIITEAITNVRRHAGASTCHVRLSVERGGRPALRVDIIDDGSGLPGQLQPGVGLISMRERAAGLGGGCTVRAAAGGGTHVSATLPLDGMKG